MSHARSISSSRTLLVLLSSTLALACNKDEPKSTATTAAAAGTPATPAAGGAPAAVPEGNGAAAVAAPAPGLVAADAEVLGHFALANPSQLLKDVKSQLVPEKYAGVLEEASLRAMLAMALEQRGDLARNFDLAAPVGCALVEVSPEPQVSCVFGYTGGAKAFMADLGEEHRLPDAAGHTAAYQFESKMAFVDTLGDRVVTSVGAETFKKSQGYLQRSILDRSGSMRGDLEFVFHVTTILDRYRSVIEPLLKGMNQTPTPPTGNPALDGALQAFKSYSERTSQNNFQRLADMAQLSLYVSVEPEGVALGGTLVPKSGSRMAQEMAAYGAPRLDPAFAGTAPSGTAMLFALAMSPQATELASMVETRQMVSQAWGAFSGRDAAAIEAAITAFQRENAALYDGQTVMALGREPGALFGMAIMSRLQSGKVARDSWKAWSASFTPEAVLGAEFSKYLTWSFADAAAVDGVAIDRMTIAPGAAAKAVMDENMKPEVRAFIDQAMGGLFLNIDRAEAEGRVIFAIAPKAEGNYMKRAIAAAQGKGNVAGEPGMARLLARDPQVGGVLAVDVREGAAWVRDLAQFGAPTANTPQTFGTDLGDFYFTFRYNTDGSMGMEYVLSQQLIAQLKGLVPN